MQKYFKSWSKNCKSDISTIIIRHQLGAGMHYQSSWRGLHQGDTSATGCGHRTITYRSRHIGALARPPPAPVPHRWPHLGLQSALLGHELLWRFLEALVRDEQWCARLQAAGGDAGAGERLLGHGQRVAGEQRGLDVAHCACHLRGPTAGRTMRPPLTQAGPSLLPATARSPANPDPQLALPASQVMAAAGPCCDMSQFNTILINLILILAIIRKLDIII